MGSNLTVRYRSPNAFLVAYAVHVSRGGLFLETDAALAAGDAVSLRLEVGSDAHIEVPARVSWRRAPGESAGPTGLGIEIIDRDDGLGSLVDRLVSAFAGKGHPLRILLLGGHAADRRATLRGVRAAVTTAEVVAAGGETEVKGDFDLVVIDLRSGADGVLAALAAVNQTLVRPAPAVALLPEPELAERARAGGAVEMLTAGGPATELRRAILRGLARPSEVLVRAPSNA